MEIQQGSTSDLAPGAITIYNSDQTTIYPDVLEDMGAGENQNTPENGPGSAPGNVTGEDGNTGSGNTGAENNTGGNSVIEILPGNGANENSGLNDITADIWGDNNTANDPLTQEQIEILNGIPEALP